MIRSHRGASIEAYSALAILRYIESCETSGIEASDHFREVAKTITAGKGAQRSVKDYMFTRYACYLIAQNGDPKKRRNCIAQSYFTVQTRKQEPIEERISEDFAIAGRQVRTADLMTASCYRFVILNVFASNSSVQSTKSAGFCKVLPIASTRFHAHLGHNRGQGRQVNSEEFLRRGHGL